MDVDLLPSQPLIPCGKYFYLHFRSKMWPRLESLSAAHQMSRGTDRILHTKIEIKVHTKIAIEIARGGGSNYDFFDNVLSSYHVQ